MKITHEQVQTNAALPMRFQIYSTEGELIPMHWHNSLEIVYILDGAMDVTVKDHITRLFSGDFTIVNSREIHGTHCTDPTTVFLLQLPYHFLKEHIPEYDFIRFRNFSSQFSFPGENSLKPIFDQMTALFSSSDTESRLRLTALLYSLMAELTAGYMVHLTETDKSRSDKNFQRLSFLMEYVEYHYKEPLGIADAAGLLHLEEAYFCRFFKRYMGQTFLEYVNSVRLRHITDDMVRTDLPLLEILERHGFHNYKVFSRLFKAAYKMTPRQKRREWSRQSDSL